MTFPHEGYDDDDGDGRGRFERGLREGYCNRVDYCK